LILSDLFLNLDSIVFQLFYLDKATAVRTWSIQIRLLRKVARQSDILPIILDYYTLFYYTLYYYKEIRFHLGQPRKEM